LAIQVVFVTETFGASPYDVSEALERADDDDHDELRELLQPQPPELDEIQENLTPQPIGQWVDSITYC
jgi:hypothetical protein